MTRVLRRARLAFVLIVAFGRLAGAQPSYSGFEQITIDNTAGGLGFTGAKIDPVGQPQAQVASCTLETANVRYTIDGTAPTSSVGLLWLSGSSLSFAGHDALRAFRAIRATGANGTLSCAYTALDPTRALAINPGISPGAAVTNNVSVASDGSTGAAVPASANYTGINIGGNLVGMTGLSLGTARAPTMAIVDGSGNQITTFGGGTQYTTGSAQATPAGTVALGWDGANVRAAATNTSGNLQVVFPSAQAVTQSGTWSTRTQDGSGSSITSTSSALDVNIKSGGATGVAQGSTTSGQLGTLTQGAVTTAAPTYTTGQTSPLSMDTAGALRVTGTVAATQSGTWNVTNAGTFAVQAAQSGTWNMRLQDGSGNAIASNANAGTRAIAAVIYDASGNAVTAFSGSGGTASNFGSAVPSSGTAAGFHDGTNMQLARVVDADTSGGTFYAMAANLVFRTSGTPVEAGTSSNPFNVVFASPQSINAAQSGTWTVQPGNTANTTAWLFKIDQTSTNNDVDATITNATLAVTQSGTWNITNAGTFAVQAAGSVAHDGVGTGVNPLLMGGYASAAAPTDVSADGDAVRAWLLRSGASVVQQAFSGTLALAGNGTAGSGVQRVTIAADSTGQVTLASGVQTIGALTANQSVNVNQLAGNTVSTGNGVSGTGVQRVSLASDSTGNIATIGTSVTPGTGATNLGKAEDGAHTSGDVGIAILTRRIDTPASSAGSSGDYATLDTDSSGRVYTNPFPTAPTAGTYLPIRLSDGSNFLTPATDYTHDAALGTITSAAGPLLIGRASAAAPANVSADDDAVAAWFLRNGSQVANLAAGSTLITATSTSLNVNCTGGCSATSVSDNSAYTASSTPGSPMMGAVDDTGTTAANENSVGIARITAQRALHINLRNNAGTEIGTAGTPIQVSLANTGSNGTAVVISGTVTANAGTGNLGANITQIGGNTVVTGGTNGSLAVGGQVAHDAVGTSVSPVLAGGYASQAAPADVSADGDATRLWTLRNGAAVVNLAAGGTLITGSGANLNTNTAQINGVTPLMGNGTTGTGSLRVTVASDNTAFSVNATATGTVAHDAVYSGNPVLVGGYASTTAPTAVSAAGDAVRLWAGLNGQQAVMLVDSAGSAVSVGGGTQYDEDTVHVSGDKLTMAGVVQQTADAAIAGDGDRTALQVDANGYLKVNIKAGAGSGGTAMADDAAFTVAVTSFTPIGGTYKSTRDSVDDNDGGAFAMNQKRGLYVTPETPNGDSIVDETLDALKVVNATAANLKAQVAAIAAISSSGTIQNAATANGNGTDLTVDGLATAIITVNCASCSGGTSVFFEGSEDNTNYAPLSIKNLGTTTFSTSTATSGVTVWEASVAGLQKLRGRIGSYSAGTVTVTAHAVPLPPSTGAVYATVVSAPTTTVTATNLQTNLNQLAGTTVSTGNGTSGTGVLRVAVASDNTAFTVNPAGSVAHDGVGTGVNPVLVGAYASAAAPSDVSADGDATRIWALRSGALAIQETYAGTIALAGNGVAGAGVQRVTIASDSTGVLGLNTGTNIIGYTSYAATASTTNSATECTIVSAASTNSTNCKASAGNFYGYDVINTTTTTYYLRLYNSSSAPTCSSATGFIRSIPIPPAAAAGQAGGAIRLTDVPVGYGTGLSYCLTGGSSSTDNTNAATGIFGAILYK